MTAAPEQNLKASQPHVLPEVHQRTASDPNASVWVGASAGSGKTTVLTNRVMRLLLSGVKPARILCLTFTRAAAAEMAIRVTDRLALWATCSEDALREDLDYLQGKAPHPDQLTEARRLFARVLACPGGMRIRTIHAFCQEILGRFPIEAGLPPHFSVIDETDAHALISDVQREIIASLKLAPDPLLSKALTRLVFDLGEHAFAPAMQNVFRDRARLRQAIRGAGGLGPLFLHIRTFLALEPSDTLENVLLNAADFASFPKEAIAEAARLLLTGTKMFKDRGQDILKWLDWPVEQRISSFEDYWRSFLTNERTPFAKFADKALAQKYPELTALLEQEARRLETVLQKLETVRLAETTEAVLRLGEELALRVDARKAAQAALDYDDLVILTNELLHRPSIAPWILYKLDGGLDHILVDEAQDTSREQWSIVKALADEFFGGSSAREGTLRTLFVVGDEKQSIFSFQNADPEAFAEMQIYFARRLKEAEQPLHAVGLHTSFRSAPAVLKAVDSVFATPRAHAGVSREPTLHIASEPRRGEDPKIGRVEVWDLFPLAPKEEKSDGTWVLPGLYEEEHDPQTELAAKIATTIASWLRDGEVLEGKGRAVRPGDIMILLRNRGRFADLMVRALKERDVPVTGVDRMKLTDQLAVMDLMALIQFTLLPDDDLTLATVLRGPLMGCTEDELMRLAITRPGTLWQSLTSQAETSARFKEFRDYASHWLRDADFVTPFAFLAQILSLPCPGGASGRRALWGRLGPDALDPIEELLNAAQNFSLRHAPSLEAFVHWINESDATIKRELDQGSGEVRIMTVHGAKGLEAPIVFLPDTTSLPRVQNVPKLLWSDEGLPLYAPRRPLLGPALDVWLQARQKQMDEYRRLLYVALTRAANRLYIAGWEQKPQAQEVSWFDLIKTSLWDLREDSSMAGPTAPLISFRDPVLSIIPPKAAEGAAAALTPGLPVPSLPVPGLPQLPAWATQTAREEKGLLDAFAPSKLETPATATPDRAFARGRIIHRLMESLPGVPASARASAASRFLSNPRHDLSKAQQLEIQEEVLKLFEEKAFAPLFGPGSRAEVPLTGSLDGRIFAGQVDRLAMVGNEIWVVDYKSSRPPPRDARGVSEGYRLQMASYRAALREIYPGQLVRCFLLWTYGPTLMELPAD